MEMALPRRRPNRLPQGHYLGLTSKRDRVRVMSGRGVKVTIGLRIRVQVRVWVEVGVRFRVSH